MAAPGSHSQLLPLLVFVPISKWVASDWAEQCVLWVSMYLKAEHFILWR